VATATTAGGTAAPEPLPTRATSKKLSLSRVSERNAPAAGQKLDP
jgi:hypothetical protein